jgi:hypothetical protein
LRILNSLLPHQAARAVRAGIELPAAAPPGGVAPAPGQMRSRARTGWLLGLAALALLLGALVYAVDRPAGSAYLLPRWMAANIPGREVFGAIGGWLPSFAHAFAFTVLTAAAMPATRWRPWLAAALWCAIGVGMEVGQHPALSGRLAAALPAWFAGVPVLDHLGAYWRRGTFDAGDLLAVVAGCTLAAALVHEAGKRGTTN